MRAVEVADRRSALMLEIAEFQRVPVFAFADRNGVVQRNMLAIAMEVGDRHDEVEPVSRRQQRGIGGRGFAHCEAGIEQHAAHDRTRKGRLEPARTREELQLLTHLDVRRVFCEPFLGDAPEKGLHEQLVPAPGEMMLVHQRHDVRLFEPHLPVRIHGQVVGEGAREEHAIDPSGRRARDRVHEDAQFERLADRLDQFEIDFFRIGLAVGMVEIAIGRRCAVRAREVVVIDAGGADELQDFLGHAVHVDGKRNAAVADKRDPEFLFLHGPAASLRGPGWLKPARTGASLGEDPLTTN